MTRQLIVCCDGTNNNLTGRRNDSNVTQLCELLKPQAQNQQETSMTTQPGVQPDRIDVNDTQSLSQRAKKLDVTESQLQEAVAEVGDQAADVEMHLKGSRSSTNSERVAAAGSS